MPPRAVILLPRPPEAERLLSDLVSLQAAVSRAIPELRAFGLDCLADALLTEAEHVRHIHNGAAWELRGAVRTPTEVTL